MHVRSRRDLISGLVVAAFGAVYFAETFRIQRVQDAVGPETFPLIVGGAMVVLGLFIAAAAFRQRAPLDLGDALGTVAGGGAGTAADAGPEAQAADAGPGGEAPAAGTATAVSAQTQEAEEPEEDPPVEVPRLLLYFGLFAVYALVMIPVGFLVSSAVFLFAITTLYKPAKWLRNAIYSVVFTVVVYFGFKDGLGVFLPPGILG